MTNIKIESISLKAIPKKIAIRSLLSTLRIGNSNKKYIKSLKKLYY